MDALARREWDNRGVTLGELLARLTPSEFVNLFSTPPQKPQLDPLKELIRLNAERGKRGLKPTLPAWFLNRK